MDTKQRFVLISAAALGMFAAGLQLSAHDDRSAVFKRIRTAQDAFQELMETPDRAIPRELLESAKCIAIIPGQKKVAWLSMPNMEKVWPCVAQNTAGAVRCS
jgi:lipid-binding SYLF domain-containing protein